MCFVTLWCPESRTSRYYIFKLFIRWFVSFHRRREGPFVRGPWSYRCVFTSIGMLRQIQQTTGRHLSKTLTSPDAAAIYNHCASIIRNDVDEISEARYLI